MNSVKNPIRGLSAQEVQSRRERGLDNSFVANPSKSNWDIIRGNTFTLFNMTSFIIAIAVLAVGSLINSLFILLVIFNITLGIVVEIRARRIVDKLTLINTDPVIALREDTQQEIAPKDIVLDDVLLLSAGDQVPTDSEVISGYAEANEALLTGESDLLIKQQGAKLLSGSFIASGQCYVRVTHVGADNYSTKLATEAKQYRPIESGLMRALGAVMKFVSWIALPLGIFLLIQALFINHVDTYTAVLAVTAGILGMIPRGMVVLIAVTLVTGVVKLGFRKVLVQEMYSIETMAHLDTLCLDKTGTLTQGKMQVAELVAVADDGSSDDSTPAEEFVQKILRHYLAVSADKNATMEALRETYGCEQASAQLSDNGHAGDSHDADDLPPVIPFSSHRKWGAVSFGRLFGIDEYLSKLGTVVLGAPEIICTQSSERLSALIASKQKSGYRVLLLGYQKDSPSAQGSQPEVIPLACIMLDDPLRDSAAETLAYFKEQGVDLKIVSGDNAQTVSIAAKRAGFEGADHYMDASNLSDQQLIEAIESTSIFGRVSPRQKKLIITTLREQGKTVGMTGDGVNDILAMREANLSIAMATGDAAAKQIANVVLLKSDFSDMPEILYEARRVVNNMLRSASIFFIKTIYSLFLVLTSSASMLMGGLFLFPFVAIQVTMADQTIGWPTFYFSFKKDRTPVKKHFLKTALMRALPNALLITASFIFVHFYGQAQGWSSIETITLMYCCLGVITFYNVIRACWPLNWHNLAILLLAIGGYFAALYLIGPFIGLGTLTAATAPVFAAIVVVSFVLWLVWQRFVKI